MFKYWLKNRFIYEILSFIVTLSSSSFLFFSNSVTNLALHNNAISVYRGLHIDFNIPSPGKEQVQELENLPHIESVIPYYSTSKDVVFELGGLTNVNVIFFDDFINNHLTMYNNERLIQKSKNEFENPLLVDYRFIKLTGLNLEDEVIIQFGNIDTTFTIQSIYETNTYYNTPVILALWRGSQKSDTELSLDRELNYSGAYITSNDLLSTQNYLQNEYKPLGRLRDRSEFDNDEAYQIHYNNFYSANYSNEISNFNELFSEGSINALNYLQISNTNLYLGLLLLIILQSFFVFVFNSRKSEKQYFKTLFNFGKSPRAYFLYSMFLNGFFSIFITIIFFNFSFINLNIYLSYSSQIGLLIPIVIAMSLYQIFAFIISFNFYSKNL
jgi:hypothetical protein